jgi:hypothetical protein
MEPQNQLTNDFEVDNIEHDSQGFQDFIERKEKSGDIKLEDLCAGASNVLKHAIKESGCKSHGKELVKLQADVVRKVKNDFEKHKTLLWVKLLSNKKGFEKVLANGSLDERSGATSSLSVAKRWGGGQEQWSMHERGLVKSVKCCAQNKDALESGRKQRTTFSYFNRHTDHDSHQHTGRKNTWTTETTNQHLQVFICVIKLLNFLNCQHWIPSRPSSPQARTKFAWPSLAASDSASLEGCSGKAKTAPVV